MLTHTHNHTRTRHTVPGAGPPPNVTATPTPQNGTIDFDEFCVMMHKQAQKSSGTELVAETFRLFDDDNEGYIDAEKLMKRGELAGQSLTKELAQEMIDQVDQDGDGKLNMDEFTALFNDLT